MLTGEIRNQIDAIWNTFWSGGIANPLEVIEQITYLLFIKRLDDLHTLEEAKANRLRRPMDRRVFPEGKDARGRSYEDFRWSRFKNFEAREMFTLIGDHVFPFLRALGREAHEPIAMLRDETAAMLREEIAAMNVTNFIVRPKRRLVEKYSEAHAWETLTIEERAELADQVAGLPSELETDDEEAKRFDLLMLHLQLAHLARSLALRGSAIR